MLKIDLWSWSSLTDILPLNYTVTPECYFNYILYVSNYKGEANTFKYRLQHTKTFLLFEAKSCSVDQGGLKHGVSLPQRAGITSVSYSTPDLISVVGGHRCFCHSCWEEFRTQSQIYMLVLITRVVATWLQLWVLLTVYWNLYHYSAEP